MDLTALLFFSQISSHLASFNLEYYCERNPHAHYASLLIGSHKFLLPFQSLLSTADWGDWRCHVCGTSYQHRRTLTEHVKKHLGQTRCSICQQEFSEVRNMRRHMVARHGMSKEEENSVTNTKVKVSNQYLRQVYTGHLPE